MDEILIDKIHLKAVIPSKSALFVQNNNLLKVKLRIFHFYYSDITKAG